MPEHPPVPRPSVTTRPRVGDLGAVVAPPYDVIDPELRRAGSSPATRPTSSASTCPVEEPGDEPDDRYRRAARTLAAWRSDGTLRKDPHPSVYVYEQAYRVPGTDDGADRSAASSPGCGSSRSGRTSGVLPHERTLTGAQGGPLPAPAGDRRQHEPGRRPVRRPSGRDRGAAGERSRAGRRTSTSSTTTASAIGCGPSRPTGTARTPSVAAAARSRPPRPDRSPSPTGTIATRRPCAIATSGG